MKNSARKNVAAQPQSVLPRATHGGKLRIGDTEFDSYIVPVAGGRFERVLSQRDTLKALGASGQDGKPGILEKSEKNRGAKLDKNGPSNDTFGSNSKDLARVVKLRFLPSRGGTPVVGYTAAQVIAFLRDWSERHARGELRENQKHIGLKATLTLGALAGVGLETMIDEACNYYPQEARFEAFDRWFREQRNLDVRRILKDDLLVAVCRLHGWTHEPGQRPPLAVIGFVGKFYECVLGETAHARFKTICNAAKSPEEARNRMYQFLAENPLSFSRDALVVAEAFAKTSRTPDDFWNSMYTHIRGYPFQLPMRFNGNAPA